MSQIKSLKLFHPSYGIRELTPSGDPFLFRLTCGGYGLTGDILSVRLGLTPIPAPRVRLRINRVRDAFGLVEPLREAASRADLVYTWHNFTQRGDTFGEGFVVEGSFVGAGEDSGLGSEGGRLLGRESSLTAESRGRWIFPLFNSLTASLFNKAYQAFVGLGCQEKSISLYNCLFPLHDKETYFRLFGRAGFLEYQVIIPVDRYAVFLNLVKKRLHQRPLPITLASAKLFRGGQDLLRFTGDGICLALNFTRCAASTGFAEFLDGVVEELGARPNIIKDSRLPATVVAATYPEYEVFHQQLAAFDPKRLYRSELSERLKL